MGEIGDIVDADDPVVDVKLYGLSGEADLNRSCGKRIKGRRPVRIPLDTHRWPAPGNDCPVGQALAGRSEFGEDSDGAVDFGLGVVVVR